LNYAGKCSINIRISNFMKIRPVRAELSHEDRPTDKRDRQTDMTKLTVAYHNFANVPKNHFFLNFDNLFLFQVWSEMKPKAFPSVFTYCREFYSYACWCGWWNTCGYLAGHTHWGLWLVPSRRDSFDCRWMSIISLDIYTWQFCTIQRLYLYESRMLMLRLL
jgi:hypothetical protein